MCEFISWINHKGRVLCLDDATLDEGRTKKLLKESKDNDFLGHGAIRAVYDLEKNEKEEHELRTFWLTDQLPKELRPKLHDFSTLKRNFGRMLTHHAQPDDLDFIIVNSPNDLKWKGLRPFCEEIFAERIKPRVDALIPKVTLEEFDLEVDYAESLPQLIERGSYGYINPDITVKNFPNDTTKQGKVKRKAVLVCVHEDAMMYEVCVVMDRLKIIDSDLHELATFGATYPGEQRRAPVVALLARWVSSGVYYVPYLDDCGGGRGLSLGYRARRWNGVCRFLGLRK